ncbi:MAG: pentapeptide repeat-containing protein, partial [Alphaproteobacteria bacterium]|nr:pentapeptide repeat-containing protein [Alphaproteobacteria bacterium]
VTATRKATMRVQKFWRQHRVPALTAVLMLSVLVGILAVSPWLPQRLGDAPAEVLIIAGIAVFSTWIAIWRGRQAQQQIRELQRQISDQNFNSAISMATHADNPVRVSAGFTRLSQLYEGARDEEVAGKYLRASQSAAVTIMRGGEKERRDAQVREATLKFLMKHSPEEWEQAKWTDGQGRERKGEWQMEDYDLRGLNLFHIMEESAGEVEAKKGWRVKAGGRYCADIQARGMNLSNAELTDATLTGARLNNADLTDASLISSDLTDSSLQKADLTGARLNNAVLKGADLTSANLTNAVLTGSSLNNAALTDVILRGANLRYADLTNAALNGSAVGAILEVDVDPTDPDQPPESSDFEDAPMLDLKDADLTMANLTGTNLTRTNLARADLTGADLVSTNLAEASLTDANLTNANLWRVAFRETRIDRADFQTVGAADPETEEKRAISSQDLQGCCWDQRDPNNAPLLPEGIDPYDLDDIPRGDRPED